MQRGQELQWLSTMTGCASDRSAGVTCTLMRFRDLKLDNTLLDGKRPGRVKLCDFGFAKQWEQENRNMFTHIG